MAGSTTATSESPRPPEVLEELEEEDELLEELDELFAIPDELLATPDVPEEEELELEVGLVPEEEPSPSPLPPQADRMAIELANSVVATSREPRHLRCLDSMVYSVAD